MATQISLAELLPDWLTALRSQAKSAATIANYREAVRQYRHWCETTGTPTASTDLTTPNVQAFLASLLDGGAAPTTARARYTGLRRFSAWLALEGVLPVDPLLTLTPPKLDSKITVALSDAELHDLIKKCQGNTFRDRRDEAIVRLMAETGIRAGECAALTTADVDTVAGRAMVRRGKGGKGRIVPFSPKTAECIDRYLRLRRTHQLADTPDLWLGERSRRFGYLALYRALVRRAALAGIDGFHPHLLRHTAATRWLAAGGSEGGLMAVAGWAKRDMLDRYTRATASERAADEASHLNLGDM